MYGAVIFSEIRLQMFYTQCLHTSCVIYIPISFKGFVKIIEGVGRLIEKCLNAIKTRHIIYVKQFWKFNSLNDILIFKKIIATVVFFFSPLFL